MPDLGMGTVVLLVQAVLNCRYEDKDYIDAIESSWDTCCSVGWTA